MLAAPFDLQAYWQAWREAIEAELDRLIPTSAPEPLRESMRYSLKAGGKRLRPMLTVATLDALQRPVPPGLPAACALELIHTQSLIHDDLPAMDNDDLRRGLPTNHKVFGEAQAILAGDAMLALAFAVLAGPLAEHYPASLCLKAVREIALATVDMVSGQVVDMASEGLAVEPAALDYIHRHKTGALIRAAIRLGAILGEAGPVASKSLDAYGEALGLAFQIADDIQDVTKSAQELGKTPGKDLAANKATFVSLYGLEAARRHALEMGQEALGALNGWDEAADPLRAIARAIMVSAQ